MAVLACGLLLGACSSGRGQRLSLTGPRPLRPLSPLFVHHPPDACSNQLHCSSDDPAADHAPTDDPAADHAPADHDYEPAATTDAEPTSGRPPDWRRDASQVVAVVAGGYNDAYATLTTYQRSPDGWSQVFGPMIADVGQAGFAPLGDKHEGDLSTPSGSFGLRDLLGIYADPGVRFPWRPVTSADVWDDDPQSALYNQWVDTATQGAAAAGANPEPMDDPPFYYYGAVIDYNTYPVVPGAGSAIFLHVTDGAPTTGCVALEMPDLLEVLKWLNPADSPRIIMGTESAVVS